MLQSTRRALLLFGMAVWAAAPARGDDADASRVLTDKGLKKVGSFWVLPSEQELQDRLKSLTPKQHELDQALEQRDRYEQDRANKRVAVQNAVAERQRLVFVAQQAEDRRDYNAVMSQLSALSDQIDAMMRYVNDSGPSEQISRRVGAAGDALYGELHELRRIADETRARYTELAADPAVAAAVAALAAETGRKVSLGPRRVFEKNVLDLERYEAAIRSEEIKVRADNGVFWIETVLNGTTPVEMVFDTGASMVSLPEEVAKRAGVVPNESDPVLRMQVADGRVVEGRLVYLSEVRVGEFTAKNVEAVICPGDMADAPPLLGGSFLRQFSIDLNHAAGTLRLTSVGSLEKPKRSPK